MRRAKRGGFSLCYMQVRVEANYYVDSIRAVWLSDLGEMSTGKRILFR